MLFLKKNYLKFVKLQWSYLEEEYLVEEYQRVLLEDQLENLKFYFKVNNFSNPHIPKYILLVHSLSRLYKSKVKKA
jgi:hypothetical protein